jgi:hypothetical protein
MCVSLRSEVHAEQSVLSPPPPPPPPPAVGSPEVFFPRLLSVRVRVCAGVCAGGASGGLVLCVAHQRARRQGRQPAHIQPRGLRGVRVPDPGCHTRQPPRTPGAAHRRYGPDKCPRPVPAPPPRGVGWNPGPGARAGRWVMSFRRTAGLPNATAHVCVCVCVSRGWVGPGGPDGPSGDGPRLQTSRPSSTRHLDSGTVSASKSPGLRSPRAVHASGTRCPDAVRVSPCTRDGRRASTGQQ